MKRVLCHLIFVDVLAATDWLSCPKDQNVKILVEMVIRSLHSSEANMTAHYKAKSSLKLDGRQMQCGLGAYQWQS